MLTVGVRSPSVDLYPADLMSAAQVDEWVDSSGTMIAGSAKDLKLALKAANQSLSKVPAGPAPSGWGCSAADKVSSPHIVQPS